MLVNELVAGCSAIEALAVHALEPRPVKRHRAPSEGLQTSGPLMIKHHRNEQTCGNEQPGGRNAVFGPAPRDGEKGGGKQQPRGAGACVQSIQSSQRFFTLGEAI
jgi:hypothetical protein